MDSESLAQVERVVTAATEGLRRDIAELRQAQETTAADLRHDIAATAVELRQEIAASAAGLRQEIASTAADLRHDIAASAEETKRHTGVLIEGLRHDIQSVAEGFQMHLDRRHAEDRDYMDREFREMRALLKLSYAQLHDRVENLDHRVSRIEQHLGLSESFGG